MTKILPLSTQRRLEKAARAAALLSYSPYSKFPVGAAVLTKSGKIFSGANVENASYGLCNCAERTAIFSAIAAGYREIRAVTVFTPTKHPTAPCGACRQVIREFGADVVFVSVCDSPEKSFSTIQALLPSAFHPGQLKRK